MKKKILSTVCLLLVSTVLLASCNTNGSSSSSDSPSTSSSESASSENSENVATTDNPRANLKENALPITTEDITIQLYVGFPSGGRQVFQSMAEYDVVKTMMEETGLKLTFVHPPENDADAFFNTMIASGDYPDFISNDFKTYPGGPTAAMDDGVLLDATPLIDEYAYYYNKQLDSLDPEVRTRSMSDDGRYVRFGTVFLCDLLDGIPHGGFLARKDYMDAAGVEIPETFEEFEAVFDAFLTQGKTPWELSFTSWHQTGFNPVASAFGLTYKDVHKEDGKIVYSRTSPKYKEYLEVMNRWYEKGYFTSDSLSQPVSEAHKSFKAGNAGATMCGSWEVANLEAIGKASDPNFEIVAFPFPRQNKGDQLTTYSNILESPETRAGFVSGYSKHPEEVVRFIDYLYKPETMKMTSWGVNTDDYALWTEDASGKRSWTEFMTDNPEFDYETGRQRYTTNALQGMWDQDMESLQYDIPSVQQAWSMWGKETDRSNLKSNYVTPTTDEAREISELLTQIETYGDEMVLKFITGKEPLDNFDAFVEQLNNLGAPRLCELYQQAQDRYDAR